MSVLLISTQDWFRILSDPDRQELDRMIKVGQLVTWPKVIPSVNHLCKHGLNMLSSAAHDREQNTN